RAAAPDRLIDVVEQRRRICREEIDRLARIERAAAADRDETVELALARVLGGFLHVPVGRLDLDAVVDVGLDAFLFQERANAIGQPELADVAVGDDQYPLEAEPAGVVGDLVHRTEPELDRRSFHHEHGFVGERHALHGFLFRLPPPRGPTGGPRVRTGYNRRRGAIGP